jgi:hypothetical protein
MIANWHSDKRRQVDAASTQRPDLGDNDNQSDATPPKTERNTPWANLALVVVSILLTLVFVEFAYRLTAGRPLLKLTNWRSERVLVNWIGDHTVVDPVLGWTLKAWKSDPDYTTIDNGIRKNFDETTIRTGGILAVGDSFTQGWEVGNDETWPAYLEWFTGAPVVNGGVYAYATDQILLRAEQLLPIVRPKTLIIGFLEHDIYRTTFTVFGAPKPYYTLENGQLHLHPPGSVEPPNQSGLLWSVAFGIRGVLEYSAFADFLLARLTPNYWYSEGTDGVYRRIEVDGAKITCALLARLKAQVDKDGIRTLLLMQHDASLVLAADQSSENARRVVACAQAVGIQVVDQFQSLRDVLRVNPNAAREYYHVHEGGVFGHMTTKGNEHAAKLVDAALAE